MKLSNKSLSARNLMITAFAVAAFSPSVAQSSPHHQSASCGELGMGVLAKSGLYGLGAGLLVSGLSLLAVEYPHNIVPPMAVGGLAGMGVGMGFGALEWASRDCQAGFSISPKLNNPLPSEETFRWKTVRMAPALEFTYRY